MYNIVQEKSINQLKPIIKEAKGKKLWLFSEYFNLCISPEELEQEIKNGFYIVKDWVLKDPLVRLRELQQPSSPVAKPSSGVN